MVRRERLLVVFLIAAIAAAGCNNTGGSGAGTGGSNNSTGTSSGTTSSGTKGGTNGGTTGGTKMPANDANGGATKAAAGFAVPRLSADEEALTLKIFKKKCKLCHHLDEKKGLMDSPGFLTTAKTLPERLTRYDKTIEGLKAKSMKTYTKNAAIIDPIVAEQDPRKRQWMWLNAYCKDPKFDDPKQKMAKVAGLAQEEIELLVRYIMNLVE